MFGALFSALVLLISVIAGSQLGFLPEFESGALHGLVGLAWILVLAAAFFVPKGSLSEKVEAELAEGDSTADYIAAIEICKRKIAENPTDRDAVLEVVDLQVDKLHDPDAAVAFLEDSLNDKEWPIEDAADIMIRMVDLEIDHRNNPQRAVELLKVAKLNFEGTTQMTPMLDRWQKVAQFA